MVCESYIYFALFFGKYSAKDLMFTSWKGFFWIIQWNNIKLSVGVINVIVSWNRWQQFSNLTPDWLAAGLPANQEPG